MLHKQPLHDSEDVVLTKATLGTPNFIGKFVGEMYSSEVYNVSTCNLTGVKLEGLRVA